MKTTGVVRRIYDLGRIVIPKEMRRTLKIREGDSLEILIDASGNVMLKKFSPLGDLKNIATSYIMALQKEIKKKIIITDMDSIVSMSKELTKKISQKKISNEIEALIIDGENRYITDRINITDSYKSEENLYINPLMVYGDRIGSLIVLSQDEIDVAPLEIFQGFLENYLLNE